MKTILKTSCIFFRTLLLFAIVFFSSATILQPEDDKPIVHVIEVESIIGPVSAEFITKSIIRAEEEKVECLIIQLDTPGGLLSSTRDIIKSFLSAHVPIVVYVWPSGAHAGSAGVFICYAAHFVAMAPSTNIGSATPVDIEGKSDSLSALSRKITNDAIAQIKGLAEKRGRNLEWAEKAVREAVNITESEALALNVINFISPSLDSLLTQLHGREAEVASGKVTLETKNAHVIQKQMNMRYRILEKISNPNVAYILLMLGIYGIFFELSNPGAIFPGVVGAIFLILAFFALETLPVNYAGLLLILLAIVLFILEVKVTSFGLLTIGGILSMILGSLMLIEQPPDNFQPVVSISISLIISVVIITAAFFIFAFGMAFKTHRKKVTTGVEGMIGEIGLAQTAINPSGTVKVHGEIWKASSSQPIKKGERIRVASVDGLTLVVEKL
jgi:membrane-bound serine protease (ClpP class)